MWLYPEIDLGTQNYEYTYISKYWDKINFNNI